MKRTILTLIISAILLITVIIWAYYSVSNNNSMELIHTFIVFLVITFGFFIGYRRVKSMKKGQPAEDELSKKIMRKTSSLSYYISLYLWLVIMNFSDKFNMETHTLIGMGILGMAVIFVICWLVINFTGLKSE